MGKSSLLYSALVATILLGSLHFVAEWFYLYWAIWWLDNITHFLGGFSLGFFWFYVFYESSLFGDKLSLSKAIFISFVSVMILGGVWEIFEYINGLTQATEEYSLDVLHDVLADALGAMLALLIAKRSR